MGNSASPAEVGSSEGLGVRLMSEQEQAWDT